MQERKHKEVAFMEERFKRVDKNENEINALRVKDAEEYNEVKIKLETDVQVNLIKLNDFVFAIKIEKCSRAKWVFRYWNNNCSK